MQQQAAALSQFFSTLDNDGAVAVAVVASLDTNTTVVVVADYIASRRAELAVDSEAVEPDGDADDDNDADHSESGTSPPSRYTHNREHHNHKRDSRLKEAQTWIEEQYERHGADPEQCWLYVYRFLMFLFARETHGSGVTIWNALDRPYLFDAQVTAEAQDRVHDLAVAMVSQIIRGVYIGFDGTGKPAPISHYLRSAFKRDREFTWVKEVKHDAKHDRFESPKDSSDPWVEVDESNSDEDPRSGVGAEMRYAHYATAYPDPFRFNPEQVFLMKEAQGLFAPLAEHTTDNWRAELQQGVETAERLRGWIDSDDPCMRAVAEIALADNRKYTEALNESKISRKLLAGDFTQVDPDNPVRCNWTRDKVRREIAKVRADVKRLYLAPNSGRNQETRFVEASEAKLKAKAWRAAVRVARKEALEAKRKAKELREAAKAFRKAVRAAKKAADPEVAA